MSEAITAEVLNAHELVQIEDQITRNGVQNPIDPTGTFPEVFIDPTVKPVDELFRSGNLYLGSWLLGEDAAWPGF